MATVTVGTTAGALDLQVRRGDKIGPIELDWGTGVDLSDRTWAAQIRSDLDETETDPIATFTVDDTDAATGTLVVTLPHSESANLVTGTTSGRATPGKATYYWDLQATSKTDPDDVFTWLAGKVKVTGDVTFS